MCLNDKNTHLDYGVLVEEIARRCRLGQEGLQNS